MSSLNEIRYFLAVARTQNISRAAELANISQPALSHAIHRLEAELGTPLLVRSKSGVQLTRAGQKFSLQSKELLEKWESLSKSVLETDTSISGNFTIGCHPSVAIYSLPAFLKKLLEDFPDLQIQLKHDLSREIASEVIAWKLDFGLVINPPEHPDLVIREIGKDEISLWSRPSDFDKDTLIFDPELFQSQLILKNLSTKKINFRRKIESTNLDVVRALTQAGCGVGILPKRVALAGSNSLKKYGKDSPTAEDRLCLIYRVGTQNNAAAKAISQAILAAKI